MRGYLVIDKELKNKFFDLCFDAYWKNNVNILNNEIVENILKKCPTDVNFFLKEIQNPKIKDELKQLTDIAFQNDIFGAPTFVVNNKIFWGQDRLDYALAEIVK